jgi:hypothetical protein
MNRAKDRQPHVIPADVGRWAIPVVDGVGCSELPFERAGLYRFVAMFDQFASPSTNLEGPHCGVYKSPDHEPATYSPDQVGATNSRNQDLNSLAQRNSVGRTEVVRTPA